MSTKTSTATTTTSVVAAPAATTHTNSNAAVNAVKIKKELPSDEIKEFAEHTMNELLGWYGFADVERLDLSMKTARLLQTAAAAAATTNAMNHQQQQQQQQNHHIEKRRSRQRAATLLQLQQQQQEHLANMQNNNNNNNATANNNRKTALNSNSYLDCKRGGSATASGSAAERAGESTPSDQETHSSREDEDDSKSPQFLENKTALTVSIEEKIDYNNCCWCRRPVAENAPEFLTTSDGPRYCSESCFTQSRRASFKKAKTCDWCKHIRHAVSYVDFQDGASQLQFCSDKCLNQYKMQIFCKETQAHLDMNPHLREQGLEAVGNGANLITPDLWLRNCRSRSASPASTLSVSPCPADRGTLSPSVGFAGTPPPKVPVSSTATPASTAPHKPLISVTPASKLMSKSPVVGTHMQTRHQQHHHHQQQSPKQHMSASLALNHNHSRRKRPLRSSLLNELSSTGILGRDVGGLKSSREASKSKLSGVVSIASNLRTSPAGRDPPPLPPSALSQFAGSSVQDLHMSVPPLSPMLEHQSSLPPPATSQSAPIQLHHGHSAHAAPPPHPHQHPHLHTMPPAYFIPPSNGPASSGGPSSAYPASRPPFMPPHSAAMMSGLLPRLLGAFGGGGMPQMPVQPPHMLQSTATNLSAALLGAPPPVTVMVPYPIIIPLPVPIPVPLPIMDFYKAYLSPDERKRLDDQERTAQQQRPRSVELLADATSEETECKVQPAELQLKTTSLEEQPLDCTKTKDDATLTPTNITSQPEDEHNNMPSFETVTSPSPADSPSVLNTPTGSAADSLESAVLTITASTVEGDVETAENGKEKLPKFKITRLQTKRTLMQSKESECSRPLRKRKRIIDCDFQKIALKEAEDCVTENHPEENPDAAERTSTSGACNISSSKVHTHKK